MAQKHPRLFFRTEDLDGLRAKRHADQIASDAWKRVGHDIPAGMALPMPQWSDGWEWDTSFDRQRPVGAVSGDCHRAITGLGLSWLLDRVEAHARKAVDLMMAPSDLDFWTRPPFFCTDHRLPWRGTLETAGICHSAACGYDWLYDFMTEGARHRLRACFL